MQQRHRYFLGELISISSLTPNRSVTNDKVRMWNTPQISEFALRYFCGGCEENHPSVFQGYRDVVFVSPT